jgi:hypothetical protein
MLVRPIRNPAWLSESWMQAVPRTARAKFDSCQGMPPVAQLLSVRTAGRTVEPKRLATCAASLLPF